MNRNPILLFFLIIFIVTNNYCYASFSHLPRKLTPPAAAAAAQTTKPDHQSPLGSPLPAVVPNLVYTETNDRCSNSISSTKSCHDGKSNHMTACLVYSDSAPKEPFLLVQNDGESPLKANFTISNVKAAFPEIQLSMHKAKKINISAHVDGVPSIILNAGNGTCIIHMGSEKPEGILYKQFPVYGTNLTPIYGVYLLLLVALTVGAAWACYKLRKNERRHVNGVPYQELEMGQADSQSANNVETAEGWDEGWDDDWDEIREVKSPNGHQTSNVSVNGIGSRNLDTGGKNWGD